MSDAKHLIVRPIAAVDARRIIHALHYSGSSVNNSQVHLGVFLADRCGGALQFGPSLDKRKMQGLVAQTPWNGFLELNRLAFADGCRATARAVRSAMRCAGYAKPIPGCSGS